MSSQEQSPVASGATVALSVILVNWNSLEVTCNAIASIKAHTAGIDYEVFVIDNGTTKDESRTVLPRRFPWLHFVANDDNRGFSKANNQGIRRAKGRYILLLNNDTIQIENALGKAVQYMDTHPDVGALGITHLNNDGARTLQPSYFRFPQPWIEIRGLLGLASDPDDGDGTGSPESGAPAEKDVDWIVGSFLLMRRSCFEDVGELDERFFIFDEDVDWCFRAWRAGWKVRYWPGAAMVHIGSASRPFMKDKTFVHFRSHLSYIKKNHSMTAAGAYYGAMAVRLTMATGKQAARALVGQAKAADVRDRLVRERQFLLLRGGRTGG